jgi:hypothetical protein
MRVPVRLSAGAPGLLLAAALATAPVHAAETTIVVEPATLAPNPRPTEAPATPSTTVRRQSHSSLMTEITAALEAERTLLRRLEAEVRGAAGSEAGLALQRQIAQVKQSTEIELLRIQARHARREGHSALAEKIEAAVRELLMTPEERAAAELVHATTADSPPEAR